MGESGRRCRTSRRRRPPRSERIARVRPESRGLASGWRAHLQFATSRWRESGSLFAQGSATATPAAVLRPLLRRAEASARRWACATETCLRAHCGAPSQCRVDTAAYEERSLCPSRTQTRRREPALLTSLSAETSDSFVSSRESTGGPPAGCALSELVGRGLVCGCAGMVRGGRPLARPRRALIASSCTRGLDGLL